MSDKRCELVIIDYFRPDGNDSILIGINGITLDVNDLSGNSITIIKDVGIKILYNDKWRNFVGFSNEELKWFVDQLKERSIPAKYNLY